MPIPLLTSRDGVVRYKDLTHDLRLWSERGIVHCEDGADGGSYRAFSIRTALTRAQSVNALTYGARDRQKHGTDQFDVQNCEKLVRLVEGVIDLCHRAKEQGDPNDPSAARDLNRRRPKTVQVPSRKAVL